MQYLELWIVSFHLYFDFFRNLYMSLKYNLCEKCTKYFNHQCKFLHSKKRRHTKACRSFGKCALHPNALTHETHFPFRKLLTRLKMMYLSAITFNNFPLCANNSFSLALQRAADLLGRLFQPLMNWNHQPARGGSCRNSCSMAPD